MNASRNDSADGSIATCSNIFMTYSCVNVLFLPVFLFVVCLGFRRCRKRRSGSSTSTHSDVFTFNMAAFETVAVLANFVPVVAKKREYVLEESLISMTTYGQTLLHILVCLERYLAVVHPITYLRLKKRGVAIRNVSIAMVWLVAVGAASVTHLRNLFVGLFTVTVTGILSVMLVSFFCASVLYVLIRPGPGERGRNRKHVDQSKRRAFYTVAAISVALLLKFVALFVFFMASLSNIFDVSQLCLFNVSCLWFHIPSSLVMPVLFLCRHFKKCNKPRKTFP